MPWLAPIFVFIGFSAATAVEISVFVVSLGVSLAIGQVSKLFLKKPTSQLSFSQDGQTLTIRQAVSPRRVIYGNVRLAGIITYLDVSSIGYQTNDFLHILITMSGHQIESFNAVYFDGEFVPIDGFGGAVGKFAGFARVEYNLGTQDQAAFADLITETGGTWTTDHRQRGCAGAYVRLKFNSTLYPNGIPNITFDVSGKKVYDPRTGTMVSSSNAALCIADYLNDPSLTQGLRYETQSQEAVFPGDKGFDFVPAIQEANMRWGPAQVPQA